VIITDQLRPKFPSCRDLTETLIIRIFQKPWSVNFLDQGEKKDQEIKSHLSLSVDFGGIQNFSHENLQGRK